MRFRIDADTNGKTVKDFLTSRLRFSNSMITALKKNDTGIMLNGIRVTVRAVLHSDDILELATSDEADDENLTIEPIPLPLDIIYEDSDIIAVNKPANMPTHPSHGHSTDTLANAVSYLYRQRGEPFVFRAVNRLDRNTSGLTLLAKNRPASYFLSEQIRAGKIKKTYFALTEGKNIGNGIIEVYMRRALPSIIERQVCGKEETGAQYSLTEYRTLASNGNRSLVCCMPKTGRTHQIRLHMAHMGCPIVSDTLYGRQSPSGLINRQALHCVSMEFKLPSGETTLLRAPLPDDFLRALKESGIEYTE